MTNNKTISIFIPSFETGGVEKNALLLTKIFSDKEYSIDICYRRCAIQGPIKDISEDVNKLRMGIAKTFPIIHPRVQDLIFIFIPYFLYLLKNRKNLKVISVQSSFLPILLCKLLNIPVVTRICNHPSLVKYERSLIQSLSNLLKRYIYRMSKIVITNSQETADYFTEVVGKKVLCIYNPFNQEEIENKSKEEVPNILKSNVFQLINIGRLVLQKDHVTLLKSVAIVKKSHPNIALCIIGDGPLKKELESLVKKLQIEENVQFLGHVSNPYPYIKHSNLFILSSLYEGLPNVLIESLSLSVPIISSNCKSGPKEILLNGQGGDLFQVGNEVELANKIIVAIENYSQTEKKLNYAKEHLDRFQLENIRKKYIEVINEI